MKIKHSESQRFWHLGDNIFFCCYKRSRSLLVVEGYEREILNILTEDFSFIEYGETDVVGFRDFIRKNSYGRSMRICVWGCETQGVRIWGFDDFITKLKEKIGEQE